ncbi:hypothetical protein BKA63DRAFT_521562 [Paraphoma chrysanthemicola]|nr:hypothetical protein BKA63DRAFT_521562 [Paraphoma chrysanthemicola]
MSSAQSGPTGDPRPATRPSPTSYQQGSSSVPLVSFSQTTINGSYSGTQNTPSQNLGAPAAGGLAASPHVQNGQLPTTAIKVPAPSTRSSIQRSIPWRQSKAIAEISMELANFICLPMLLFFQIAGYRNGRESLACAEYSIRIAAWTADLDYCQYAESHGLAIPSGVSCSISPPSRLTGNSCDLELHPHEQEVKRMIHAASAIRTDHLQHLSILLVVMIVLATMFSARLLSDSMPPHAALDAADREGMSIRFQLSSDVERGQPQPLTCGKAPIIEPNNTRGVFRLFIDGAWTFRTPFNLRKVAQGGFHRLCRFMRGRYPSNLSNAIVDVLLADPHLAQLAVLAMLRCPEDFDYEAYVMGLLDIYYVLLAAAILGPKGQPSRDHDLFPTIALLWVEALKHERLAIAAEILARLHTNVPWTATSVRNASIQHMAELYHLRFKHTHSRAQLETDVDRVAQFLTEGEAYANFRRGLMGVVNG